MSLPKLPLEGCYLDGDSKAKNECEFENIKRARLGRYPNIDAIPLVRRRQGLDVGCMDAVGPVRNVDVLAYQVRAWRGAEAAFGIHR